MKGDTRITGALTQCPLFYSRPIHALVPTCTVHHYADGQSIYQTGEAATHLVVLSNGSAELLDDAGQPARTYRAPAAFGEAGLFAPHRKRTATVRAAGNVDAVFVPRDALLRAAVGDMVVTERLLTALADAADPPPRRRPTPTGRASFP
jgi:CRP-like cAMP-binding protein